MKKRSDLFDLSGKVCVVIGAGLIGSECALRCGTHGATVIVADTDKKKAAGVAGTIIKAGGNAAPYVVDSLSDVSVKTLAAAVAKHFKRVDALVNTTYPRTAQWGKHFEDLSYEEFSKHVATHTGAQFLTTRAFAKLMKKQKAGSIVLIGSIYGTHAPRFEMYEGSDINPPAIEYAIAKGGLAMMTKYLAKYYGQSGIRVNMLSPGGVADKQSKSFARKYGAHATLGNRMLAPSDLSGTLVYLFSEASRDVTGQNIIVDGGWTL